MLAVSSFNADTIAVSPDASVVVVVKPLFGAPFKIVQVKSAAVAIPPT